MSFFFSPCRSYERNDPNLDSRPLRVSGVPALFIPGNAGSHKQSRSSASIALRMHQAEFAAKKHFDFFTVNLNEVGFSQQLHFHRIVLVLVYRNCRACLVAYLTGKPVKSECIQYKYRVLPKQVLRQSGWAWFGRSL